MTHFKAIFLIPAAATCLPTLPDAPVFSVCCGQKEPASRRRLFPAASLPLLSCDPWICGNRPWRAERGSRAWTNPWTGKKTPAHRFAHPAPLFHIPTGAIANLKKKAKEQEPKSNESNVVLDGLFWRFPTATM